MLYRPATAGVQDGNINDSTSFDRGSVHRSQHGVILPHELYQIVVLHISAVIVQADSIERLFSRYGVRLPLTLTAQMSSCRGETKRIMIFGK